jgi:hypothetical protein
MSRGARSEGEPRQGRLKRTTSSGARSEGLERTLGKPSSSRSRSRNSDQLLADRKETSTGSLGSGRGRKKDESLHAYIRRIRKVATSCDTALEQQKASFQSVPEELIELQQKMVGVFTLVKELEGEGFKGRCTIRRTRDSSLALLSVLRGKCGASWTPSPAHSILSEPDGGRTYTRR